MAIYGVTIKGRGRRVLVRETSAAKAVAHFIEAKALSAEEMQDALDEGERVWREGEELPADLPDAEAAPDRAPKPDKAKGEEPKAD